MKLMIMYYDKSQVRNNDYDAVRQEIDLIPRIEQDLFCSIFYELPEEANILANFGYVKVFLMKNTYDAPFILYSGSTPSKEIVQYLCRLHSRVDMSNEEFDKDVFFGLPN